MLEFPDIKGFSYRNLRAIKQWYVFYTTAHDNLATTCSQIGQQAVTQLTKIPWGHNIAIISKCKNHTEALYYVTNTQQIKDPYIFDFLTLTKDYTEHELEQGLVKHITRFLLELGSGFAYIGKQVPLQVGQRDFYLDLLFYHTKLHCYVVIELKTTDFEPEHTGKLNFYIKAVDEIIRNKGDKATIGILLCKNKDKLVAEYALSDINKPIAVSEYQLTHTLPDKLKSSLPSVEEIEDEFNRIKL
ncbi:FIG074102: hypothetical protein [hydrothermal vent metagenome]|uniref:YhcG PDDEXK nuclease domain-containing protein n=1 Tax=hydrothermal vent metagenome TaxID=652676 RepID=A0A3B0VSQ6_9ZZZZ